MQTGAAMILFYDIDGDPADHDRWHSEEHFAERLAVPGFRRATRWVGAPDGPRCLVVYAASDVGVATSEGYLARLNAPSRWTQAIMPRFRGMIRGFATLAAGAGLGQGGQARALRLTAEGAAALAPRVAELAARPGIVSAHLWRPEPAPPMTAEQALRGPDRPLPWVLVLTGWDAAALEGLDPGGAGVLGDARYALAHDAAATG